MKEQLLRTWQTNHEKNLLLLQNLTEEQLTASLSASGRNVGGQLAHLHNTRLQWTEQVARALYQKSLLLPKDTVLTKALLSEAFGHSATIISQVINQSWENEGKLPPFKAGLIPFVGYLISHESHHRGAILLTLKQKGYKLPEELKWGLWKW